MNLITKDNSLILWQDIIKEAENNCAITLNRELESYLATLLMRYTNRPEIANIIIASSFLESMQQDNSQRIFLLQSVGDQCLLFSGLFPKMADKRQVKLSYFVNIGRSAYHAISNQANDMFDALSLQFVMLMDVLQAVDNKAILLPLEAYEQWTELGSLRAYRILQSYRQ